eukprot:gnl/Dysnectes_brevis/582_a644_7192.p1 GENE.gnl/Dysnectes_brevis/582_a644_7192~~gnl/Dysnectes_brevis/582_a644_7192.p1  ORF type:complete len:164 (+),score=43.89 gnl/Dysnectes_brevis/582_a644_7192:83-574(+)
MDVTTIVNGILASLFNAFDADYNGKVDLAEAKVMLFKLNGLTAEQLSEEFCEEVFHAFDADKSGELSRDEFSDFVLDLVDIDLGLDEEALTAIQTSIFSTFEQLDADKDGQISVAEFHTFADGLDAETCGEFRRDYLKLMYRGDQTLTKENLLAAYLGMFFIR